MALVLLPVPAFAQRIITQEPGNDEQVVSSPAPHVDRPVLVFVQPVQTAIYAGASIAGNSGTEIAVPIGIGFEASSTADYLVELTLVNVRGDGALAFTGLPGFNGQSGKFSRTSLYGSLGYQMYSGSHRTGLLFTPKFYGRIIQESQTVPAEDHVGLQAGAGFDLGLSLQYERFCVQLVGGLSVGITGGAVHQTFLSPLTSLGGLTGGTTAMGPVIDLNANLFRLGFVF